MCEIRIVLPLRPLDKLGASKVCDEDVHALVKQDIFRFQVPMDDALVMQIFNSCHELTRVELSAVNRLGSQLGNELEQVAVLGVSHDKIQPLKILSKIQNQIVLLKQMSFIKTYLE